MPDNDQPTTLADSLRKITGEAKKPSPELVVRPNLATIRERVAIIVDRMKREVDSAQLRGISADTQAMLRARIKELVDRDETPLTQAEKGVMFQETLDEIFGFGPLGPYLRDPSIGDIFVNSTLCMYVERNRRLEKIESCFDDEKHLMEIIERIVLPLGLQLDANHPVVSARLPNGSRVEAAVPPVSIDGPILALRCFGTTIMSLGQLVERGSVSLPMAELLRAYVKDRVNIIVSGPRGSGRTTFLNALSAHIPPHDRVISAERTTELRLQHEHWIRLEARTAREAGEHEVTVQNLVTMALRMGAERIVLADCNGPEAYELLDAADAGATGYLMTIAASSPTNCIRRLERMIITGVPQMLPEYAHEIVSNGVQVIVQTERCSDGHRRISEIAEVRTTRAGKTRLATMFKLESHTDEKTGETVFEHVPVTAKSAYVSKIQRYKRDDIDRRF